MEDLPFLLYSSTRRYIAVHGSKYNARPAVHGSSEIIAQQYTAVHSGTWQYAAVYESSVKNYAAVHTAVHAAAKMTYANTS